MLQFAVFNSAQMRYHRPRDHRQICRMELPSVKVHGATGNVQLTFGPKHGCNPQRAGSRRDGRLRGNVGGKTQMEMYRAPMNAFRQTIAVNRHGRQCGAIQSNPIHPIHPINAMNPINPMNPIHPINPMHPVHPMQPINPMHSVHPMHSMHSMHPMHPIHPIHPINAINQIHRNNTPCHLPVRPQYTENVRAVRPPISTQSPSLQPDLSGLRLQPHFSCPSLQSNLQSPSLYPDFNASSLQADLKPYSMRSDQVCSDRASNFFSHSCGVPF